MHELALMHDLVEAVREAVGDATVTRVRLEIGALAAVMPDALRFCFEVCAQGTSIEGALLEIVAVPGRARCRRCGAEFALGSSWRACRCGSWDLALLAGEELRVRDVEVS